MVEEIGPSVTQFEVGDRVFGLRSGAHAEYVCVRESRLVARMPDRMTFEEAAATCDGMYQARNALRAGRVGKDTRLVIYGASGSLGTAAVQLASDLGAKVTAVCNGRNVELVRSLGADEVVDYEREDFTRNGQTYDVVLDAVGKHSFLRCRRSLVPGGIYVATDRLYNLPLALLTRWSSRRVVFDFSGHDRESVLLVKELFESGRYRPIIDRTYPLEDVVEATQVRRELAEDRQRRPHPERRGAMKAAVHERYGAPDAVVEIRELEKPEPADDEVLVRVQASSVNIAEWYGVTGRPWIARPTTGMRGPKDIRLGVDFAGIVESVGKEVTDFAPATRSSAAGAVRGPSTSASEPSVPSRRSRQRDGRARRGGRNRRGHQRCRRCATRAVSCPGRGC